MNDENRVIVNSLVDCMKMLNFYEKLVHRWLSKLAKYGGRNAQNLCKEIIDLKGKIALELERFLLPFLRLKNLHICKSSRTSNFQM